MILNSNTDNKINCNTREEDLSLPALNIVLKPEGPKPEVVY